MKTPWALFRTRPAGGVTLIEMMVVIAVLGVLIAVVAPSVRKLLDTQRLRGVSAQLTTDFQFARTEAASRQEVTGISFRYVPGSQSCYIVHTCGSLAPAACICDCTQPAGSQCPAQSVGNPDPPRQIRTVTVLSGQGVEIGPTTMSGLPVTEARVLFDPVTGSMVSFFPNSLVLPPMPPPGMFAGTARLVAPAAATGAIRTEVNLAGRPRNCNGVAPCP
jgi:type IV fimbrial biogenesis protein FimT